MRFRHPARAGQRTNLTTSWQKGANIKPYRALLIAPAPAAARKQARPCDYPPGAGCWDVWRGQPDVLGAKGWFDNKGSDIETFACFSQHLRLGGQRQSQIAGMVQDSGVVYSTSVGRQSSWR
ncbi:hypothetical protein J4530_12135 [Neisseria subflava]|uniref:hypothetical protein n=1 Tax=Neisseria subflava TaxID=28449 RepID=UPI00202A6710|nr:hypothetical protein [Neisseria subflava]MCL9788835.1 hypothetical protein [Neisseria subflava]